ncbi:NUDIX hydrolase [Candidatus Izemoplasma sp. B36]|uniref:NUDIX hydrolase n=1 Tax=Candidatus Izemoplasma sp. B36 TaxID=3242468 RepID=UPI0035571872
MMTLYNLILVLNQDKTKVLFLHRSKDPYKGLYNLIGGKIEADENYLESAYRELFEETGIQKSDIKLIPFIDFIWHPFDMEMKVFIGKLNKEVTLVEELHKLYWFDIDENFFDMTKFAGEGNIGHMINIYFLNKEIV